eukprot:scaffold212996_cov37-Tisochrysis_lutea.AAC.3
MEQIIARDDEDGEKLAAGIREAVARGTLDASPPVEPVTDINVSGKSADAVAGEIIAKLGTAPASGCVLVLQGLSGTGKGTTVAKLEVSAHAARECACRCARHCRPGPWNDAHNLAFRLRNCCPSACKGITFSSEAITDEVTARPIAALTTRSREP